MGMNYNNARAESFNITHFLIRLVVGSIVLAITAFLTPGFTITNIWSLILGAVVLALLDFFATRLLGVNATPFGRGITGFILAAAIIYLTQFFVAGFRVSILGAIIGALIYGVVDLIIPGRAM